MPLVMLECQQSWRMQNSHHQWLLRYSLDNCIWQSSRHVSCSSNEQILVDFVDLQVGLKVSVV